jgi:hypothetical protein
MDKVSHAHRGLFELSSLHFVSSKILLVRFLFYFILFQNGEKEMFFRLPSYQISKKKKTEKNKSGLSRTTQVCTQSDGHSVFFFFFFGFLDGVKEYSIRSLAHFRSPVFMTT